MNTNRLEIWTVATFNLVVFSLVLVLLGHVSGALTDILPGLGTGPGILAFAYLWALLLLGTKWALAEEGLSGVRDQSLSVLVSRGILAGGFVGAGFVIGVFAVIGVGALVTRGVELTSLGFVVVLGSVAGAVVGAIVGLVFVLLDVVLARIADQ